MLALSVIAPSDLPWPLRLGVTSPTTSVGCASRVPCVTTTPDTVESRRSTPARPDLGIARPGLERVGGFAPDPAIDIRLVVGGGQRLPGSRLHVQQLRLHLEQPRGHLRGRRLPHVRGIGSVRHAFPGGREVAVDGVPGRRYLSGEQAVAEVVVCGDLRGKAALGGRPVVGAAVGIQIKAAAAGLAVGKRRGAEHQRRVP